MNIIGTGLTGMVGSRIVELLSQQFEFENLSLETGIDITDKKAVTERILKSNAEWVFHFAAYTDVDKAELERSDGERSISWKVNVAATETITSVCEQTDKKLLYVSTDYVFDGRKEFYTEEDEPNPIGWYGITKYEGERRVATLGRKGLILRIANPYRPPWSGKADFVQKIWERLREDGHVTAPTDQVFVPTLVDDIAQALKHLVKHNASGVYHVVGSEALSPYDAVLAIAEQFSLPSDGVRGTTFKKYFKDKAPRPLHAYLKNDKITKSGVRMRTFREGLQSLGKYKEVSECQ